MTDEEFDEMEEVPDLPPESSVTAMLEGLDALEGCGDPGEAPPLVPALNRGEIDALVDQVLDDELRRLSGRKG